MKQNEGLPPEDRYVVKPVLGAFRALEALARSTKPLSLNELAAGAGMTKPTAFRYLRTLCVIGYATKLPAGTYTIGHSVYVLSNEDSREKALRAQAEPLLHELYDHFGETVNLGVPKGRRIHYVSIIESKRPLRLKAEVGDSDWFHCTALGKVMLAFMPPDDIVHHINSSLPSFTERTITTRRRLDIELAEVRRFGFAADREENEIGCTCYAAPIFDDLARPIAAVSISIPQPRLNERLDLAIPEAVMVTARGITDRLAAGRFALRDSVAVASARGAGHAARRKAKPDAV